MYLPESQAGDETPGQRRRLPRYEVQCRARIQIGTRQYAGYLHDISQAGAKLRTITPIRRPGRVILRLPDLPLLRCQLRWTDAYNAGVSFELALSRAEFSRWAKGRSRISGQNHLPERDIVELEFEG